MNLEEKEFESFMLNGKIKKVLLANPFNKMVKKEPQVLEKKINEIRCNYSLSLKNELKDIEEEHNMYRNLLLYFHKETSKKEQAGGVLSDSGVMNVIDRFKGQQKSDSVEHVGFLIGLSTSCKQKRYTANYFINLKNMFVASDIQVYLEKVEHSKLYQYGRAIIEHKIKHSNK